MCDLMSTIRANHGTLPCGSSGEIPVGMSLPGGAREWEVNLDIPLRLWCERELRAVPGRCDARV